VVAAPPVGFDPLQVSLPPSLPSACATLPCHQPSFLPFIFCGLFAHPAAGFSTPQELQRDLEILEADRIDRAYRMETHHHGIPPPTLAPQSRSPPTGVSPIVAPPLLAPPAVGAEHWAKAERLRELKGLFDEVEFSFLLLFRLFLGSLLGSYQGSASIIT